jgi:hypothetical protein
MNQTDGTITVRIGEFIDYGLDVFDSGGSRIGTIYDYNRAGDYMTVRERPVSEEFLYIPYSAITHIDPREAFVRTTLDEAQRLYRDPPVDGTSRRSASVGPSSDSGHDPRWDA